MAKLGVIGYKVINDLNKEYCIVPYKIKTMEDFKGFVDMFWLLYEVYDYIPFEVAKYVNVFEKVLGYKSYIIKSNIRYVNRLVSEYV